MKNREPLMIIIRSNRLMTPMLMLLFGIFMLLLPPANGLVKAQAAPVKKTVLVLFPYQVDLPVSMIAAQAIREEFGSVVDLNLDVYYEYLDINRFPDPGNQKQQFELFIAKYKRKQVDLVIVASETMLNLWLAHRADILPNTPTDFFDITIDRLDVLNLPADVSGVTGVVDYIRSVQWVLDKMPAVNEIVIVHGVGQADQEYIQPVLTLQEKMKGQIKFTDLSDLPLSEIKQRVAKLPKTSVVLYHLMFEDADGNKHRPIEALRELAAISSVPVISGYDQFIGTGTIGGYMYSIDQQARDAVMIGLRVLRGEAASSILIKGNQSNHFIFDHPALQRYNIPLSFLPPDSIIKNRQYSLWELYRTQIILVAASFAFLLLLVAYLGAVTQRLTRARADLSQLNANLESQVQERTAALRQNNRELELEITERKWAEEKLQESELRFRSIIEQAPVAIALSRKGIGLFANQKFADMLRLSNVEEFTRTPVADYFAPQFREDSKERARRRSLGLPVPAEFETIAKRHDGSLVPVQVTIETVHLADGDANMAFATDITERKQAEKALRESAEKWRSLFEVLPVGVSIVDSENRVTDTNSALSQILEISQEGLLKGEYLNWRYLRSNHTLMPPEEFPSIRAVKEQKIIRNVEIGIEKEYGAIIWTSVSATPLSSGSSTATVTAGITERKQAELQREATLEALRASEERYRSILNASPDDITITDLDGRILMVSPSALIICGYDRGDEMVGRLVSDFIVPEDRDRAASNIGLMFQGVMSGSGEYHGLRGDGSTFDMDANAEFIRDAEGQPIQIVFIVRDITERKRAEQAMHEMRSRLQLLGENLDGAALYVYSHDANGQTHFEYLSESMEKITGITQDEIFRDVSRLHSLIMPEYMPKLVELEAKSKRDLIDFEIEVRQRHAVTGNIHWALLRSTPRRRPDGSTVWYGVQMDITERKRNEKLLEDANEELHTQLDEIEQLQTELREQALRDPLTGLFNRRYMNEALAREIARAGRENNPLSVIMADIDHFKMINDTYGHPVGDKFVVEIASLMRNHARSSDIVCRYGGEEFLLVLPGTASDFAAQRAEEIRQRCAEIIIQHDEKDLKVTISMGVATYPAHGQKADEIIIKADKALYRAKAQGRNCTVLFE